MELNHIIILAASANILNHPLQLILQIHLSLIDFLIKKWEVCVISDTKNTIHKLNQQIQDITTELEAIKIFVKEKNYLTKQSLTEIDNPSKLQRNKEFIELLQHQNKNLVEENKSESTIIQMLIGNQNNLEKLHLKSNLTPKLTRNSNKKQRQKIANVKLKLLNKK